MVDFIEVFDLFLFSVFVYLLFPPLVTTAVSKVVVYTLTGQVVKQFEGSFEANYNFDIQGLSVGVYIVKIIKEDGNEKIVKLVKQ